MTRPVLQIGTAAESGFPPSGGAAGRGFAEIRRGRIRARVLPEFADVLFGPRGLRLGEWRKQGAAAEVKGGRHRNVFRVELPQGNFYVKQYRGVGLQARVSNLVRGCKAERELRAIELVAAAGIPTVQTVAVARRLSGPLTGESWLVTREMANTVTLQEFVDSQDRDNWPATFRQSLAAELARFIARLHRHGLLYGDLHAGNLLIRPTTVDDAGDSEFQLWLIDPQPLVVRRRLSTENVLANLAQFHHYFSIRTSPADRLRFLHAYRDALGEHPIAAQGVRDVLTVLDAAARNWSLRAFDKADRKWFDGHRKLIIHEENGRCVRAVAELGRDVVAQVARDPRSARPVVAAALNSAATAPVDDDAGGAAGAAVQRNWLGKTHTWSRSRAVWEIGHALLRRGIPTPRPLLLVEQLPHGSPLEEVVTGNAARAASDPFADVDADADRIRKAARLLRRLHDHGFLHVEPADVFLIDERTGAVQIGGVASIASVSEVAREQIVGQFARLTAVRLRPSNRLRFLSSYLKRSERATWKSLWRDAATQSPPNDSGRGREPDGEATLSRRRVLQSAAAAVFAACIGCQTPKHETFARPARHSIRSGPMIVMSDFKLEGSHPAIEDLVNLRKQVTVALDLPPSREEVVVYIFRNEREYQSYLNSVYPNLPNRRAYFVGTTEELAVYTYWGERIQEDLRHEYTHGLLHSSLRTVPLWLDEGLAEYFEVGGPRPGTVNTEYSGRIAASLMNGWKPDMRKLEQLEDFSQMQHIHYQESWAWVHFLLHHSPDTRQVLLEYLKDLRTNRRPTLLSERLRGDLPNCEQRFVGHLATLQTPQLLPARFIQPASAESNAPITE